MKRRLRHYRREIGPQSKDNGHGSEKSGYVVAIAIGM